MNFKNRIYVKVRSFEDSCAFLIFFQNCGTCCSCIEKYHNFERNERTLVEKFKFSQYLRYNITQILTKNYELLSKFSKFHNLEFKPVLTSAFSVRYSNQIECTWSQSLLIEVSVMIVKLEVCLKGRLECLK